jgi:hypothetical protein
VGKNIGGNKMILSTTFNELKKHDACEDGYKKLAKYLGGITQYGKSTPINLLTILESNGIEDCIWSLRAAIEPDRDKIARLFAADCAESVLPIFESEKPDDPRPRKAIQAARDFAAGLITNQERDAAGDAARDAARAAARDAAGDAARVAARAAARATAWVAAGDTAWVAAWVAARATAGAAARATAGAAQSENLRKYLTGEK